MGFSEWYADYPRGFDSMYDAAKTAYEAGAREAEGKYEALAAEVRDILEITRNGERIYGGEWRIHETPTIAAALSAGREQAREVEW